MQDSPTCASTPNSGIRGRKTYRNDATYISPISKECENQVDHLSYSSAEDTCDSDIEEENLVSKDSSRKTNSQSSYVNESANVTTYSYTMSITIVGVVIVFAYFLLPYYTSSADSSDKKICDLKTLKANYVLDVNVWYAIESSLNEINERDKPSVLLLLYKSHNKTQIESFLSDFTNKCSLDENLPELIINGKHLNTEDNYKSFGNIITYYGPKLEKTGIMIVKDVDDVDSYVAQAFHTFCDEYTPLVRHSLIIFTLKYDNLNGKDVAIAEQILRRKWSGLNDDILEPLLTRVIGMVVKFH